MLAVEFQQPIEDAFSKLFSYIPNLIVLILILVVGYFIARFIRRATITLLRKIRFDDYIDKAGIGGPLERAGFADSGRFLAMIIYYLVMLVVLQVALSAFGDNPVSDVVNDLIAFIPKAIVAIAIIIVTGLVANAVRNVLAPTVAEQEFGPLAVNVAVFAIWVIGAFAALDQLEFAADIVDQLFTAIIGSLSLILILKFGIGGIWEARDRFWPAVYDRVTGTKKDGTPVQ
ncbi:MAG: mechanosensitive ion channel family protein [Acidimicrobiales bacterium]